MQKGKQIRISDAVDKDLCFRHLEGTKFVFNYRTNSWYALDASQLVDALVNAYPECCTALNDARTELHNVREKLDSMVSYYEGEC